MSGRSATPGDGGAARRRVRVAIVGGTGYGGMELLRYLLDHPHVEVTALTSRTESGAVADAFPHLRGLTALRFTTVRAVDLAAENDVVFFAAPHGVAAKEVPAVLDARPGVKVIDLSGDFRLRDAAAYPSVYGWTHPAPDRLAAASYGLPECGGREATASPTCRLVANPGCHASATLLSLYPLARAGLLRARATVVSVTGSSGSGADPKKGTHHPERFANFKAYKPLTHQHVPEIEQALARAGAAGPRVAFVPCSGPFSRGIAVTTVVEVGERAEEALAAYRDAYAREPFVRLVPEAAEVRAVAGTNFADVGVVAKDGALCATVAIDNLGKGMAGSAVQNLNLLCDFPETTGLLRAGAGL